MNESSIECLLGFFEALISKDEEKIKRFTQLTWLYRFADLSVIEFLPPVKEYTIDQESKDQDCVYTFKVTINKDFKTLVRVIREVAPYKPDPLGENGQWGVNPLSILNNLEKVG